MFLHFIKNQKGVTLIELITVVIILGIALPSLITVVGISAARSGENGIYDKAIVYAESKMEEIIQYKESRWDWYKDTSAFIKTEVLEEGFTREVTIRNISYWGAAKLNAWEVAVIVTHKRLPNGFMLTTRFTKYD